MNNQSTHHSSAPAYHRHYVHTIVILALVVIAVFASSCSRGDFRIGKWSFAGWNGPWGNVRGSGVEKNDTRSVEQFTGVSIKGHFVVEIDGTENKEVKISGDDNVLSYVRTSVRNGILYISLEQNVDCDRDLRVSIGNKALSSIESSGASQIIVNNLSTESLEIQTSGMAEIQLHNVQIANALTMESAGASEVIGSGKAREINVDVSGASDVALRDMPAERARVKLSGAGDISVSATEELDARVAGAGTVTYFGKPKNVRMKTAGAGEVVQGDENERRKDKE